MMPIAEASTVHVPTVDRSAAPAPTLTTIWLWGFCHRYSSTTPRYVMFLPMSNIAREWWASAGAAARAIPTATATASNGRRAREPITLTNYQINQLPDYLMEALIRSISSRTRRSAVSDARDV